MKRSLRRGLAAGAATLLGMGLLGVGTVPAYAAAAEVDSPTALNQAITDGDSPIILTGHIQMDVDVLAITYPVEIIGNEYTIDFDGNGGFSFSDSVTVSDLIVANARDDAFAVVLPPGSDGEFTDVTVYGAGDDAFDVSADEAELRMSRILIDGINNAGLKFADQSGDVSVTIDELEVEVAEWGIDIDQLYGTSTFSITNTSLIDVWAGIEFDAGDEAAITVTNSAFLAGSAWNAGGNGSGLNGYLFDDATLHMTGSAVIGDPDGARFTDGTNIDTNDESSLLIENSYFYGNDFANVHVHVYDDSTFTLLRSTVVGAIQFGVYLCEITGFVTIDQTTIEGNGGNGQAALYGWLFSQKPNAMILSRSTISGNGSTGIELEMDRSGTTATVINSTISGNSGEGEERYPAIQVTAMFEGTPSFNLYYSTVTANSGVGAGLALSGMNSVVWNSIVSGNALAEATPRRSLRWTVPRSRRVGASSAPCERTARRTPQARA